MRINLTESPLESPEEDLLGVALHARQLAEFVAQVPLPFTVGLYGSWGSGKTSFANMLAFYLKSMPGWTHLRYIKFSAWPYVTADAIWQALLELVARELSDQDTPSVSKADHGVETWQARLREVLLSPAFALKAEDADARKMRYEQLVARLNIAQGMATRTASQRVEGLTLAKALGLVLDSASSMSPALGPLRKLFLGENGSSGLVGNEQSTPSLIRSIEDVRTQLQEIYANSHHVRLVVLIDDLDRCLPEVALDVLETVKIFFFESMATSAQCLFLVAADERLVARGLQVRLSSAAAQTPRAIDIDARAYLEKIVHLGISLPPVDSLHPHRLIAAWSPEWVCAADLVIQALEGNPRRIKQQATLLSYRYRVKSQSGGSADPQASLHKLIRLNAIEHKAIDALRSLLRTEIDASEVLRNHEESEGHAPVNNDETELASLLRSNTQLKSAFCQSPPLSGVRVDRLRAEIEVANLRAADGAILCADACLPYVIETVQDQKGSTTTDTLALAYCRRVVRLARRFPVLMQELRALLSADETLYGVSVLEFDNWCRDPRTDGTDGSGQAPPESIRALIDACPTILTGDDDRLELVARPSLPEIPGAYVAATAEIQTSQPPGRSLDVTSEAGEMSKLLSSRVAQADQERLLIAKDIVDRRAFVKQELLFSAWPEIAALARGTEGRKRLRRFADLVVTRDPGVEPPADFAPMLDDQRLRDYLRMQPLLSQLLPEDLAQVQPKPTFSGPVPDNGYPTVDERPTPVYENFLLEGGSPAGIDTAGTLIFSVDLPHGLSSVTVSAPPIAELRELVRRLPFRDPTSMPLTRDVAPPQFALTGKAAAREIGSILWQHVFARERPIAEAFSQALRRSERVRLMIRSDDVQVLGLPWECLYIPEYRIFAGQSLKLSVARSMPETVEIAPRPIEGRLRVLVIAASPKQVPLPTVRQEAGLIVQTLDQCGAETHVVENPTLEQVLQTVRSLRPHVVHFAGHGVVENGRGSLILVDDDGNAVRVDAEYFGSVLQERNVLLALLNGCDTGTGEVLDLAAGVAQVLVRQGIPAAISTSRSVQDDCAIHFAADFYASFAQGSPLEVALIEARKSLALAGWDWSAYVLYASEKFPLHEVRVEQIRTTA